MEYLVFVPAMPRKMSMCIWTHSRQDIYICIYLEPVCPLFWGLNPPKEGTLQSKQGPFGFWVYIYTYMSCLCYSYSDYLFKTLPKTNIGIGFAHRPKPKRKVVSQASFFFQEAG